MGEAPDAGLNAYSHKAKWTNTDIPRPSGTELAYFLNSLPERTATQSRPCRSRESGCFTYILLVYDPRDYKVGREDIDKEKYMKPTRALLGLTFHFVLLSVVLRATYSAEPEQSVFQDPLARARSLDRQGKTDEAVEQYLLYYADNPEKHEVLQYISGVYENGGRYREAIDYVERTLVIGDESLIRDSHFADQCDRLFRLWKKAGAGKIMRVLGKADGVELAQEHYQAKLGEVATGSRMTILSHVMLGDVALQTKDVVQARQCYRAALDMISPPQDAWHKAVNHVLLRKFIRQQWLDDALLAYRNAPSGAYLKELGGILRRQGRGFEMVALYEDYLFGSDVEADDITGTHYGHKGLTFRIIDELLSVGRGDSLIEQYNHATTERQKEHKLHRAFGYLLCRTKRYDEGLRELEKYLALAERALVSDYQWIGGLCQEVGMLDQAITFYEAARDTKVTDEEVRRESMSSSLSASDAHWRGRFRARVLEALGDLYIEHDRLVEAETCFREMVDLASGRSKEAAQEKLGEVWEWLGKENVFVEELKSKVAHDPCDAGLRVEFGQSLLRAAKAGEAAEQFERAAELSGDNLSIRLQLAEALAKGGQIKRAIIEYQKVLYTGLQRNRDQFRRGKGGDDTEPWRVLHKLAAFCRRVGEEDTLLAVYEEVLGRLDLPETKWKPDESRLKMMLRDITEILDSKGRYDCVVSVWLDYLKEVGPYARDAIRDRIEYVDTGPLKVRLQELTTRDPNDYWGWFILADVLAGDNYDEEAMKIYAKLLAEVPANARLHHDLAEVFGRMNRYDLMVEACKKQLSRVKKGSRDYGRMSGRIAQMYLELAFKEQAAEFYRKAISCEASQTEHQQYQHGLFKATGGKEGVEEGDVTVAGPAGDLDAMRIQAELLLHRESDYIGAARLYEQVLARAPTDLKSMVYLGVAYEKLGDIEKATALYEDVTFNKELRPWAHGNSYYGAIGSLQRIYGMDKDIQKQIKLFTVTGGGNYRDIKGGLKEQEEFEAFHEYLLEQLEQTPKNVKLRFYLVEHYSERKEKAKAGEMLEQLQKELTNEQGVVASIGYAMQLARAFEALGRYDDALAVLPAADYENNPDRNGWMGELLMRLYANAGQWDETLKICRLRLAKDPKGHHTVAIAEQLAQALSGHVDGHTLLHSFLKDMKSQMRARQYRRFAGAAKAFLAAQPAKQASGSSEADVLALLKDGRKVRVPKGCRSFAEFLEQLASQADTVATQSFMGRYGQRRRAPRVGMDQGSSFEVLAAAIDGTNIPFEITQDGHWAFFESGDKSKRINYGAVGGLFCRLWEVYNVPDSDGLRLGGRVSFAPEVAGNMVSIQSTFTVIEAIDNKGRKMPSPDATTRWDSSTQIEILLGKQKPAARSIKQLRVKTAVVIGTKWVTFKIERLDHTEAIIVEKDGVRIRIEPIKQVTWGAEPCWEMPIDIQRHSIELDAKGSVELKTDLYFVTKDGQKHHFGGSGSFPSASSATIAPRPDIDAFDPATTSLVIRGPAAIEVVPFELTFRNIPIIER